MTTKSSAKKDEQEIEHVTQERSYNEVQTLLEWIAPGRPFKKRGKSFFATSLTILFFIEVILFLFSQYILMVVCLSVVFVAFVLATVPPQPLHYRISTEGLFVEDHFYLWQELYDFYFFTQQGEEQLYVRTHFLPGLLTIMTGEVTKEEIKKTLLPFLPFREYVKPTFVDKAAAWMEKTFPLEASSKNTKS